MTSKSQNKKTQMVSEKRQADNPLADVAAKYPVKITDTMRSAIKKDGSVSQDELLKDPVAAQFYPSENELVSSYLAKKDPIGDEKHSPVPGIVHRHPDRVLLKALHSCPVYCRFCFRKEMVGPTGRMLSKDELKDALDYIETNTQIREVILTGGDPLMLSARRLAEICGRLHTMDHLDNIRFHTRVPIVSPDLMSEDKIKAMSGEKGFDASKPVYPKPVYVVMHINHAQEFTDAGIKACRDLSRAGIPLLNEFVLLKGINDSADALEDLMRISIRHKIKPYYMHHLDQAPGTEHFRVSIAKGRELMRELKQRVSGLAMPTYVLDIPGGVAKIPVSDCKVEKIDVSNSDTETTTYEITDPKGQTHIYIDTAAQEP